MKSNLPRCKQGCSAQGDLYKAMEEVLGGAGPPALGDAAQHPSMDTLSITALGFREGERWMNE